MFEKWINKVQKKNVLKGIVHSKIKSFQTRKTFVHLRNTNFIKNILVCVPKMNEGLTGLEQDEGE